MGKKIRFVCRDRLRMALRKTVALVPESHVPSISAGRESKQGAGEN